jgi:hypothetical protein
MSFQKSNIGNKVTGDKVTGDKVTRGQNDQALSKVREQLQAASAEVDNIVLAGNVNLDHDNAVADANMRYLETGITYRSHGRHVREDGKAREYESILNHMCVCKDLVATIKVLTDPTTDHFPLLASVSINKLTPSNKFIEQRNFKKLSPALLRALETWHWSDVYRIRDPDAILEFINKGIVHGMDLAAPLKRITVEEGTLPLYLFPDTLALMAQRDSLGRGLKYKAVRNRVTALVRRDKELSILAESMNLPTVLWEIANAAVGNPRQPLPATVKDTEGNDKKGNLKTANVVNTYYVEKVGKTRASTRGVENSTRESATTSRSGDTRGKISSTFSDDFANAGRIAKIFTGLKSTSALGTHGIPVTILKMGSDVLAEPISHLVNMSLSDSIILSVFKTALFQPVYKGRGKAKNEPASYRPVAILCAMSKVLETVAREDLEAFMKANNILPRCSTASRRGANVPRPLPRPTRPGSWPSLRWWL